MPDTEWNRTTATQGKWVLQLCHDYKAPFLSVAKQYASLFEGTDYKVLTVYIKGEPDDSVAKESNSHNVVFLNHKTRDLKGLKRAQINEIRKLHREYNFSFAIAHRYKALYIASHAPDLFCIGVFHIRNGFSRLMRRLYVTSRKKNIALVGVSKAVRDNMRQHLRFFPQDKIQHLYNSLDVEKIQSQQLPKSEARKHLGLRYDDYIIGNVGRLHRDKDQATLIKAFHRAQKDLPDNAKLVIMGEGKLRSDLEELISDLGLDEKTILMGSVDSAFKYFRALDCFILSSIKEGLPVALLEAYAAGCLCATSRCDGNIEAIEGVGNSFNIGDFEKLSSILIKYNKMDDKTISAQTKKMGTKLKKNFSSNSMKKSFWNLTFLQNHNSN